MKHENSGFCPKCHQIIDFYPGLHASLLNWFEKFQKDHPEAHISCAGRGEAEQNLKFDEGLSRAQWSESAHNWNCAIDLFVQKQGLDIYDKNWFHHVVEPNIPDYLTWYGKPGSEFYELPHVELKAWRMLRASALIKLVESDLRIA